MIPILDAYLYGTRVVELHDAGAGELSIQYTPDAVSKGNAARLSLSLPVRTERYSSRRGGNRWVRSILPEPPLRDRVAAQFALAADDHSGLLRRIGRDVAGAVVIVPTGEDPTDNRSGTEPITHREIERLFDRLPTVPLAIERDSGFRLSLAGQQSKLLLVRTADGWKKPAYGFPSTTILKPEPDRWGGLASNELLSLKLAETVGLTAASAQVEHFGERVALTVERYDRKVPADGTIARLHQEDVLTAMGIDPQYKYEHDDEYGTRGPSLIKIAALIDAHVGRIGVLDLLKIVTFNLAIGNADAHARNTSLLLAPDGTVTFAPLYDLVSTAVYDNASRDLSQRIAGKATIDDVTVADLVTEAVSWGLPQGLSQRSATGLLESTVEALDPATDVAVSAGADSYHVAAVSDLVQKRVKHILSQ